MLNKVREKLEPYSDRFGSELGRALPYPWAWSLLGLLAAMLSAYEFYMGMPALAGMLILVSGFFDVADGAVARSLGKAGPRGAFLDSNLDRISELVIYAGILLGGYVEPYLVFLAATSSLLVSYARARVEGLGRRPKGLELGERAERLLALAALSILGLVWWAIIIVSILAIATYIERVFLYYSNLER